MKLFTKYYADIIIKALQEDLGSGDITTNSVITTKTRARGIIRAKQEGIVCGQSVARDTFRHLNRNCRYVIKVRDGQRVRRGTVIAEIKSDLKTLLSGERVALNFLMQLSGISTLTSEFVRAVKGRRVTILDTRKTTPGLRMLQKYAVSCGGGENHRIGLYDMYLIKDNHIESAGSIAAAIEACLETRGRRRLKIEVETKSLAEIREALKYNIERIMLDNMTPALMKKACLLIRKTNPKIEIEASGNVRLGNVRKIAQTGVDYISIGGLTHSAPSLDLSMEIIRNG